MVTTVVEPLSASEDTRRNAHTFWCDTVMGRPSYAVCLDVIRKHNSVELPKDRRDCGRSLRNDQCPALAMRTAELAKGQAIYFQERVRFGSAAPAITALVSFVQKVGEKLKPSKPQPKGIDFNSGSVGDYSDVVNKMVADGRIVVTPSVEFVKAIEKVEFLPGETPLQAARRINSTKGINQ